MEYLNKSCKMNNGTACFYLSGIYLSGMYMSGGQISLTPNSNKKSNVENPEKSLIVQKDMKKAFELTTKACELNNFFACANLSRMYTAFAKENAKKSELYKKKTEELRSKQNCKPISAYFEHA